MERLLSAPEAAKVIGVSEHQVRAWTRRATDPLPHVVVGKVGKYRMVIAAEIDAWLAAEAERMGAARRDGA